MHIVQAVGRVGNREYFDLFLESEPMPATWRSGGPPIPILNFEPGKIVDKTVWGGMNADRFKDILRGPWKFRVWTRNRFIDLVDLEFDDLWLPAPDVIDMMNNAMAIGYSEGNDSALRSVRSALGINT